MVRQEPPISILLVRMNELTSTGIGWEDVIVILMREGLARKKGPGAKKDRIIVRRYVLTTAHERIKKDPNYYHRADGGLVL